MKLEVGMYVRTDNGKIGKFVKEVNDYYELEYKHNLIDLIFKNRCLKASHNLINLIEVGDYVNGSKIGYVDDLKGCMRQFYYDYEEPSEDVGHWGENIKSIVTKEQFESMSYKVGE